MYIIIKCTTRIGFLKILGNKASLSLRFRFYCDLILVLIQFARACVFKTMKLTLSLQPGNKLQLPMEIDDDKAALMTVADFKGKITQAVNLTSVQKER